MDHHGNVFCRFFARGYCKFGNRCRNSHNLTVGKRGFQPRYGPRPPRSLDLSDEPSTSSSSSTSLARQTRYQSSILPDEGPSTSSTQGASSRSSTPSSAESSHPGSTNKGSTQKEAEEEDDDALQSKLEDTRTEENQSCGICLEEIRNGKMFGILVNCSHSFCMDCIRGWRMRKEYELNVKQACPECRTVSEFVIPSKYWVQEDKKEEFVASYRERVSRIDCKYFRRGTGWCRFQERCLYRHKMPDGSDPDYSKLPKPRCYDCIRTIGLSPEDLLDSDDEEFFIPEYLQESSLSYSSLSEDSDDLDDLYSSSSDDDDSDEDDDEQLAQLNLYVLMNVIDMCSN